MPCEFDVDEVLPVAVGCDWLPREAHGKERVSGSSPEEAADAYHEFIDS